MRVFQEIVFLVLATMTRMVFRPSCVVVAIATIRIRKYSPATKKIVRTGRTTIAMASRIVLIRPVNRERIVDVRPRRVGKFATMAKMTIAIRSLIVSMRIAKVRPHVDVYQTKRPVATTVSMTIAMV
jgi:hypothetical protein